jgi:hypothetical protein
MHYFVYQVKLSNNNTSLYCHGYSVRVAHNQSVLADQWGGYTELAKRAH